MIGIRNTLAIMCLASATIATASSAQALDPGIVRTFDNVAILLDKPDFSKLATARWWCMQKGFVKETQYQFDYLQPLGDYGYDADYKSISCVRGVQS
jgi:hypothetical protein